MQWWFPHPQTSLYLRCGDLFGNGIILSLYICSILPLVLSEVPLVVGENNEVRPNRSGTLPTDKITR